MTRKNTRIPSIFFILSLCLAAGAAASGPVAEATIDASSVYFQPTVKGDFQLTVAGPDGFALRRTFTASAPAFTVADTDGVDGAYRYELVNLPRVPENADRAEIARQPRLAQSGVVTLAGGGFVDPDLPEGGFNKDQVFTDDVIVDGSACIGIDCTNGMSFGFDTLVLRENNLRILFDDTSGSASFPNNDWRLTANDSANGGANRFSIEDATAGRTPFTIKAGAANNALYVDDNGDIGLGTSNPAVELHVVDGDSPTLRLEQDGSSGFTAQTWDLAGNETNFFVRDVTGGSKLPFKIKPGAPDNSLFVAADGDVGLGTQSPDSDLDVEAANPEIRLTGTDSGQQWEIKLNNAGRLNFQAQTTSNNVLQLDGGANANLLRVGVNSADQVDIAGKLAVSTLATGGNAGSSLCIGSGGELCACGACP